MAKPEYRHIYASARWCRLRRRALDRDRYLCMMCRAKGEYKAGKEVDHIVPVDVDMARAYDLDNLQTLCHDCHTRKTRADKHRQIEYVFCYHGYLKGSMTEDGKELICCP